MPDGLTILELLLGSVAVVVLFGLVFLFGRRRWLAAQGWVFDCSLRPVTTTPSTGWMLGVARLSGENLEWYRVFSASFRPAVILRRRGTRLASLRETDPAESAILYDQARVAQLRGESASVELAMSTDNLTALLSWLEAAPPGVDYN